MSDNPEIERLLLQDPAGIYAASDALTRARYHATIRFWAERSGWKGTDIVRCALALAERHHASPSRGHVGYYLVGPGAGLILAQLALRLSLRERTLRWLRRNPMLAYATLVCVMMIAMLAGVWRLATASGASWALLAVLLLSGLSVYFTVAVMIARALLAPFFPARVLPKLDMPAGIPDSCRTLVAVPSMLTSPARARVLVEHLARLSQAHPDRNLRFALIGDFPDAPAREMPDDAEMLAAASDAVACLNRREGDTRGRFFLLQRERTWNAAEGVWMGWERKRGKVQDLLRVLQQPHAAAAFRWSFGGFEAVRDAGPFRYLIVLDDDSWLEAGEAVDLIRTAAHPLNHVEYADMATGCRQAGYGLFQPNAIVDPPAPRNGYELVMFGDASRLPPKNARAWIPNFFFDILGIGVFEGKGLYDVEATGRRLRDVFPENAMLQHDYIEGFWVGTANLGDVFVIEPMPSRIVTAGAQMRRWIRGEAQALPWVLPIVRDARGVWRRNLIPIAGRCIIAGRMVYRFMEASSVALLLLAWTLVPRAPVVWTAIALSPILLEVLAFPATMLIYRHVRALAAGSATMGLGDIVKFFNHQLVRVALSVTLLAHRAAFTWHESLRAAWRVLVSQRHLLEWKAQHDVDELTGDTLGAYGRILRPSWLIGLGTLLAVGMLAPRKLPVAAPFALAWLLAFVLVWVLDQPLPDPSRRQLTVARDAVPPGEGRP